MGKNAILVAVILALMSAMTLANVVFAAQSDEPGNSPPGKANVGKGKAKATGSTEQLEDVEENVKCTILHKDNAITVSTNALPAHVLNHEDVLDPSTTQPDRCTALFDELTEEQTPVVQPVASDQLANEDQSTGGTVEGQESQQQNNETKDTATATTCDGESIGLSKEEKLILDLHNKTREENGLEQLCVDPTLQKAARAHSRDMVKGHYFGHDSRGGKTSGERLKDLGYDWSATGENLARGSGSYSKPKSRFEAWMKSDGHKKNILDKSFEQVGVGVAKGKLKKGGQEQTVYTVDFASKRK